MKLAEPPGLLVLGIAMRVAIDVVEIEHGSQRAWRLLEVKPGDVSEIGNPDVAADAARLERFVDAPQVRQTLRTVQMFEKRVAERERHGGRTEQGRVQVHRHVR